MAVTPQATAPVGVVVGAGGLLGSAVDAALTEPQRGPSTDGLAWHDHAKLQLQFRSLVDGLRHVSGHRPWVVYWCAGVGYVGAPDEVHRSDQRTLELFLDELVHNPPQTPGVFALASSAGAIYAGNRTWPANEFTADAPVHGYGDSKLSQERIVLAALAHTPNIRSVFMRISNLYGLGQTIGKPQGLLSHLVVNSFRRSPSMIFVPLDTSRDYLFTTDAAQMVLRAAHQALAQAPASTTTRLLASERNHTIAQVMATLSRIMKRRVPFVVRTTRDTVRQPPILSFRSIDRSQHLLARVSLEEGIARIIAEYAQGPVSNQRALA